MERKNYYALDIAKFISAFLVICIHCGPLLDVSETGNFVLVQIIARLAVPFFFVASGFLLFQKIDLQREWNDYENKAKLKHYVGRLCKIYLIWTILYLPFNYLLVSENGISLMEILRYLRDFFFTGSYYHLCFDCGSSYRIWFIVSCWFTENNMDQFHFISIRDGRECIC